VCSPSDDLLHSLGERLEASAAEKTAAIHCENQIRMQIEEKDRQLREKDAQIKKQRRRINRLLRGGEKPGGNKKGREEDEEDGGVFGWLTSNTAEEISKKAGAAAKAQAKPVESDAGTCQ
jgi:hypothetical protein